MFLDYGANATHIAELLGVCTRVVRDDIQSLGLSLWSNIVDEDLLHVLRGIYLEGHPAMGRRVIERRPVSFMIA